MKIKVTSFFAIVTFLTGCAGPRTGSVGYRHTPPVLATNVVGTVISQQVGDQPPVVYAQTNFTVISTPPVQDRTWKEKVFGQRPPADTRVIPPVPNAAVGGVTPTTVTVPRGTSGRQVVAPQGASGGNRRLQPRWPTTLSTFGNGLRSFLLPTIYGGDGYHGTGASVIASAQVYGRVRVPMTRFERSALGHAASIGTPLPRYGGYGTTVVRSHTVVVGMAGRAEAISGLALSR